MDFVWAGSQYKQLSWNNFPDLAELCYRLSQDRKHGTHFHALPFDSAVSSQLSTWNLEDRAAQSEHSRVNILESRGVIFLRCCYHFLQWSWDLIQQLCVALCCKTCSKTMNNITCKCFSSNPTKTIITGWWYIYPSEKYEFVSWVFIIPYINGQS